MVAAGVLAGLKALAKEQDEPIGDDDRWEELRRNAMRSPRTARLRLEWEIAQLGVEHDEGPPPLLMSILELQSEYRHLRECAESRLADLRDQLRAETIPALPSLSSFGNDVPAPSPLQLQIWEIENSLSYAARLVDHELMRREELFAQDERERPRKRIPTSQLELRQWAVSAWITLIRDALAAADHRSLAEQLDLLSKLVTDRRVADYVPSADQFRDWNAGLRAPTDEQRYVVDSLLKVASVQGRIANKDVHEIKSFGETWARLKTVSAAQRSTKDK